MVRSVVITGVGMVTPLGQSPAEVLARIGRSERAEEAPPFDTSALLCRSYAPVREFSAEQYVDDIKSLRLMSRDAQLAVAAAKMALQDAGVTPGNTYPAEGIALYGSTGLTGMPAEEVAALVRHSADAEGRLDLARFGRVTLKRVRPVLSFKILANMPICFVSIFSGIRGENGIYTPWEGQGAQAIVAGIRAIEEGRVRCALVGGCDVRTHEFAFVSLKQLGVFRSWAERGEGTVPGEGSAFLVLEEETSARARGARGCVRVSGHALGTSPGNGESGRTMETLVERLKTQDVRHVVCAGDGEPSLRQAETQTLQRMKLGSAVAVHPKTHLGNLFAAAAAVQVGLAAQITRGTGRGEQTLANCFGHGSQLGSFLLEAI